MGRAQRTCYVTEFEGLRGLLALWVVCGHWSTTAAFEHPILRTHLYVSSAVDVFIMLSGFAIASLLIERQEPYALYLARRFLRIFPIYLFYLVLSILAAGLVLEVWRASGGSGNATRVAIAQSSLDYYWWHIMAHLPALHGVVPRAWLPATDYAFIGQAWSISLEWQFYLLAPLVMAQLAMLRTAKGAALAIVATAALIVLSPHMPHGFIGNSAHKFAIGIASVFLVRAVRDGGVSWLRPTLALAALVGVGLVFARTAAIPYLVWAAAVTIVLVKDNEAWASRLGAGLNAGPMQWLGHMSYSIYLSHMLVMVLAVWLLGDTASGPAGALLLLAVVLAATLLVSWATHALIEKPCHEVGRNLGRGARVLQPA